MKDSDFLLQEKYRGKKSIAFYIDKLRLATGEPLAYIVGNQPFLKVNIDLSYKTLIPRPETEYWLYEYVFKRLRQAEQGNLKLLDIFSGSGCIALAIQKEFPKFYVCATDKSKRAIKQIKKNAKLNALNQIKVLQSDLFGNIDEKFDIIIANPPYVPLRSISWPVLLWEPLEATFARKDGLLLIEKFLTQVSKYLNDNGEVYMEFEENQRKAILALLKNSTHWQTVQILKDQYGKDRVLFLKKRSLA